jgi:carboxypeptidase Taq
MKDLFDEYRTYNTVEIKQGVLKLPTSETSRTEVQQVLDQFKQLDQKICHYADILALLAWDLNTGAPRKGRPIFSKAKGTLSSDLFALTVSDEMGHCLEVLARDDVFEHLDEATKACIRIRKREYDRFKKIPADLYKEFVILTSDAHTVWEEARATNRFELYRPTLERLVEMTRQFVEYYGYEGHPYNALLDDYEPGLTVETLDPLFADLRQNSIKLLQRIQASPHQPDSEMFAKTYDPSVQREFNLWLLPQLGYDMEAGRLDVSAHPFCQAINTGDVRITTRFIEDNLRSALFGTIHECGHALYEQGINPEFEGTVLRAGTSYGIHESQSRFLENIVGRSRAFWQHFYPELQRRFPTQLGEVPVEEFYRAINLVTPSYIRVEADELTYNLHIMIRYEIEKGLISGEYKVQDLPEIWNAKMKDYLGIEPPSDALGVLQDVHWSFGGFGYFPSYSLGNLYAAQILYTIKKQLPDFDTLIANGQFSTIREWLREHIHQYGKQYTPEELIQRVTGEPLNSKYLIQYLEEKYTDVYRL